MQRKEMTPENALLRLESLCAASERCTFEIETKLRAWGIPQREAEKIVDSLVDNRFVDNERFTRAFVNDKVRFSGYGRMKIRMLLAAKRIDREIVDEALQSIDEDEYREKLDSLIATKARQIGDVECYEGRAKLYRFGLSRGFESALVSEAIKLVIKEKRSEE